MPSKSDRVRIITCLSTALVHVRNSGKSSSFQTKYINLSNLHGAFVFPYAMRDWLDVPFHIGQKLGKSRLGVRLAECAVSLKLFIERLSFSTRTNRTPRPGVVGLILASGLHEQ